MFRRIVSGAKGNGIAWENEKQHISVWEYAAVIVLADEVGTRFERV